MTQGNDEGGEVNSPADDAINGDGTGAGGASDPLTDEDDEDPEDIMVEVFDLALRKTLNVTTQQPIVNGRDVIFDITVFNQGFVDAFNIEVTDYLPLTGLSLNDGNWTVSGGLATYNTLLDIPSGGQETITITFTVDDGFNGTVNNYSEISEAEDEFGDNPEDIDSTPDQDNTDDDLVDNEINEAPPVDEDDHDIEPVEIKSFDLALRKTLNPGTQQPILNNRDVIFDIEVFNQGDLDATLVEITDYIPAGLTLNDGGWTDNLDGTATYNTLLSVSSGNSQTVTITFRVDDGFSGVLNNYAEISDDADEFGAPIDDIDSDTDTDNGNDDLVNNEIDEVPPVDEDDHDIEPIEVKKFDLALRKTLNPSTQQPIVNNRDVIFDIEVFNQGNVAATLVEITDYIPAGLTLNDGGWTDNLDGTATYNTLLSVSVGNSQTITVTFRVNDGFSGTVMNMAEISDDADEFGAPADDIDSDTDTNPDNDVTVDNEIDEVPPVDEDDKDPEVIEVLEFDLALRKTLNPGTQQPILNNRDVIFDIEVFNQGDLNATLVEITDYIPAGLTLNDGGWTDNLDGTATYNTLLSVSSGNSQTVTITFRVDDGFSGVLNNYAEISDDADEFGAPIDDIDSDTDTDNGNDDLVNNEIDEVPPVDEDDHDIEPIEVKKFDLALRKTLNPSTQQPIVNNRDVIFDIEVFNQGNVAATLVEITDYIPAGLTLNDGGWTDNLDGTATYNTLLSVSVGNSQTITVTFRVNDGFSGTVMNMAEISDDADEFGAPADDIDSDTDTNPDNDVTVDNEINEVPPVDEDDKDPEVIEVLEFDLALRKTLNPGTQQPILNNRDVIFDIEVFNQGDLNATLVEITDYIPAGLTLNDGGWTDNLDGTATYNTLLSVSSGNSQTVTITFRVDDGFSGVLNNYAEISDDADEFGAPIDDIDSDTDTDNGNDDLVNNEIDEVPPVDEDDHDIEPIEVKKFDLALRKTLNPGTQQPIVNNRDVIFDIEVFNQGNVAATLVEITDYIPAGLTLNDGGWTDNLDGTATYNTLLSVSAGNSQTITVTFRVNDGFSGTVMNMAEISDDADEFGAPADDIDSDTDTNPDNDVTVDNEINEVPPVDEDDKDPEVIEVLEFDLALRKTLNPGTQQPILNNRDVIFDIEVFNQGDLNATLVEITDYIPAGLTLNDGGWTDNLDGTATYNTLLSVSSGNSQTVTITFRVDDGFSGVLNNYAEISDDADEFGAPIDDIDSDTDTDNGNDDLVNNEIDEVPPVDEDDHDIEPIEVKKFDLALRKTLNPGTQQPIVNNRDVIFDIEVFNQGNVAATLVEITDYIPAGLTLNDGGWTDNLDGTATYNTLLSVSAGNSQTITVTFRVNDGFSGTVMNMAEISDDADEFGAPADDIDSDTDTNPDNDVTVDDEIDEVPPVDEDDKDPEVIEVLEFDLALRKTLNPGTQQPILNNRDVIFDIEVFNQGDLNATLVEITDYIPAGLTLNDGGWTDNLDGTATYNTLLSVSSGNSQTVTITFRVDDGFSGVLNNYAEISDDADEFGAPIDDIDSDTDTDNGNDDLVNNEIDEVPPVDEDDHDIEPIEVKKFDLALRKTTDVVGIVRADEDVLFTIEVHNQGTVTAQNIDIIDVIPDGLELSGNDTNNWTPGPGNTATNTIDGPLAPGETTTIDILLHIKPDVLAGVYINNAEITGADDENDMPADDIDSDPDTDPDNDDLVDNEINEVPPVDEDDHDIEPIDVCDIIPPVLAGIPDDTTINCHDPIPDPPVIGVEITATDESGLNVEIILEEESTQDGDVSKCEHYNYEITRTWIATDECDNSSSESQTIVVEDVDPPTFTFIPADKTIECDETVVFGVPETDDNCSAVSVETMNMQDPNANCAGGTYMRIWIARDVCGNSSSAAQTISLEDTTPPIAGEIPVDITIECDDNVPPFDPMWDDNCDTDLRLEAISGINNQTPCSYDIERVWTATDNCGNSASVSQVIHVEDFTDPYFIFVPADVTIECDEPVVFGTPTFDDNCDTDVTLTMDDIELADAVCGFLSIHTRIWTVTDDCGNSAKASQTITLEDTTPPVITCPADLTIECDEDIDPSNTGTATATDNCTPDNAIDITYEDVDSSLGGCNGSGTITRVWTAKDLCGNSSTCEQRITIEDTTPPVITCPADLTIECDEDIDPSSTGSATATDNCGPDNSLDIDYEDDVSGLSGCNGSGVLLRTWTATDDCDNSSTCVQRITIEDTTPPVITCPADLTIECDEDIDPSNTGSASAIDNCQDANTIDIDYDDDASGLSGCNGSGVLLRTWIATDDCDNSSTCVQRITIEDTTPPVITCPADLTIECDEDIDPSNTGSATATDNCGPDNSLDIDYEDDASGLSGCNGSGVLLRTWTATDDCDNSSTCVQRITIEDTTPPVITCPPDLTIECNEDIDPSNTGSATATDNCGPDNSLDIDYEDDASGLTGCNGSGVLVRTWTATDDCDNSSSCEQRITIEDTTPPVITCPADLTIECDEDIDPSNTGSATATDNCGPDNSLDIDYEDDASGLTGCNGSGVLVRTWTATDDCDNSSSCEQRITIEDTTPPVITCPADLTIECDEDIDPSNTGSATATDNCGPDNSLDIDYEDDASGLTGCNGSGVLVRTWTATDDCDNSSTCEQRITIEDTTPPVITCPADLTIECDEDIDPSNTGSATATDNCGPDNSLDIDYEDDASGLTGCNGSGVLIRTWTATDDCDNSSTCVQRITIEDTTPPVITCPADLTIECDEDIDPSNTGSATATDNCGPDNSLDIDYEDDASGLTGCNGSGVLVRTWTATDDCDNSSSCEQRITIEDTTPPVITCPADLTIECDEDIDPSNTGSATATDNCGPDNSLDIDYEDDVSGLSGCNGSGVLLRTWIATDDCDNSSTCEQRITIEDTTPPVITCPTDLTIECDEDIDPSNTGSATATDNCGPDNSLDIDYEDDVSGLSGCNGSGVLLRTWIATDDCDNSSTCVQRITIEDTTPPVITCPTDLTIECDEDIDPSNTGSATATDNCGPDNSLDIDYIDDASGLSGCNGSGVLLRTWTATDDCDNSSTCVQRITIEDTTPPVITCPADLTIECDEDIDPSNTGSATATDNCGPDNSLDIDYEDDASGLSGCNGSGVLLRTWIATDDCDNSSTCVQRITIEDTTPPVITCPADLTIECDEDIDPSNTGSATATDNCGPDNSLDIDYEDDVSGLSGCNGSGVLLRTWIATDDCDNSSTCVQRITIEDTTPPVITCPADLTIECDEDIDPSNTGSATATDNCGPDNSLDIDYEDDVSGLSGCNGSGVLLRTWTATDDCDNSSTCVQRITIEDTTPPVITCPADLTIECDEDIDPSNTGSATATDNCGPDNSLDIDYEDDVSGLSGCNGSGVLVRTWTATDDCDNSSTCVQRITIEDTTPPVITCPADLTIECDEDIDPSNTGSATATDNCGPDNSLDIDYEDDASGLSGCNGSGVLLRTWTATDDCDNSSTCVQRITIEDTTPPVITCPADLTIECDEDIDPSNTGSASAIDNCQDANTIDIDYDDDVSGLSGCNGSGVLVRTWTATDDCDNSSSCEQRITIEDTTPPVITCPTDLTIECDEDIDPSNTGSATATDNCGPDNSLDIDYDDDALVV